MNMRFEVRRVEAEELAEQGAQIGEDVAYAITNLSSGQAQPLLRLFPSNTIGEMVRELVGGWAEHLVNEEADGRRGRLSTIDEGEEDDGSRRATTPYNDPAVEAEEPAVDDRIAKHAASTFVMSVKLAKARKELQAEKAKCGKARAELAVARRANPAEEPAGDDRIAKHAASTFVMSVKLAKTR